MDHENKAKEIGKIILNGLERYKTIDINLMVENGENDKERNRSKKIIFDDMITEIQDILIKYEGKDSLLLPYSSRFFYDRGW